MNTAKLLDSKAVQKITSLKPWTIRRLVRANRFPPPCKPTGGTNYWSIKDIQDWLDALTSSIEEIDHVKYSK